MPPSVEEIGQAAEASITRRTADEILSKPKPRFGRGLLFVGAGAILSLLVGGGFAAVNIYNRTTTQPAASPAISPSQPLSSDERSKISDTPLAGDTDLSVTNLGASNAELGTTKTQTLQAGGDVILQANLNVAGNGTFGGTVTAANFVGRGSGLSGINADTLGGAPRTYFEGLGGNVSGIAASLAQLIANAALRNAANTFTAANIFQAAVSIDNLTLTSPLSVSSGGTGLASVASRAVLYGTGGSTLAAAVPGSAGLCLLSGVADVQWGACTAGSVSTLGGTTNALAKFTGANSIGDSSISDTGSLVTVASSLEVINGSSQNVITADATTGTVKLGQASVPGKLAIASGNVLSASLMLQVSNGLASDRTLTLNPSGFTSDHTLTLPDADGTICLENSVTCGFITGSGAAYVQGGNTFGATANLGTNDANALNLLTNGVTVASYSATGSALLRNAVNSTAALQVQNSSQSNLLRIDTATSPNLITNPSFEVDTAGWSAKGGAVLARDTAERYDDLASLSVTASAINDGAGYAYNYSPTTTYTLSLYARMASGSMSTFAMGHRDNGADNNCLSGQTVTSSGWTRFICTFTAGPVVSGSSIYVKQTDATARTFFIDGVQFEQAGSVSPFQQGLITLGGVVASPTVLRNNSDSTAAFQILNAANTSLLVADTTTSRIGIGSNVAMTGKLNVAGQNITVGRFNQTGTGNILDLQKSDVSVFAVDASGATLLHNNADSTAALRVTNLATNGVVTVDTTGGQVILGEASALAGKLVFRNATNANSVTLQSNVVSAGRIISLPDEDGTVCLQSSVNCGFAVGSAGSYIQNQSASAQATSNYWISGTGRADTSLTSVLFDTPTAGALGIGTTNATQINLNKSTTITGDLTFANGATRLITIATPGVAGPGDALTLQGSAANGANAGGILNIFGGAASATAGSNGGAIALAAANGSGTGTGGSGGGISLTAGNGLGAGNTNGGDITLQAGARANGGTNGSIYFQNGTGEQLLSVDGSNNQTIVGQSNVRDGKLLFANATNGNRITLRSNTAASATLTLPAETGTLCSTASVCTGYAPSATNGYVALAPTVAQADTTTNSSIFIDKQNATGNLLQLQRGAVDILSVGNGGATLFKNSTDSTTAFQVQNAAGTTTALSVDTVNLAVGINTAPAPGASVYIRTKNSTSIGQIVQGVVSQTSDLLQLQSSSGASRMSIGPGSDYNQSSYNSGTINFVTVNPNANMLAASTADFNALAVTPIVNVGAGASGSFRGILVNPTYTSVPSGTLLPLDIQNGGTSVFSVERTGKVVARNSSDSAAAFQIQNAAATQLFGVDSTPNSNQLLSNGSFEQNTTGWTAKGSATISQITSQQLYGSGSMQIATTTANSDGAKADITLTASTQYVLSFYAKSTAGYSSFYYGYACDGADETGAVCAGTSSGNTTIGTAGWTKFSLTFTPSSISGTPYVYIKQNSGGTARTFYVDGVELEANAGGNSNPYRESKLLLNGAITSPLIVQPTNDSTGAFQIDNSAGLSVLAVDTLNNRVSIGSSTSSNKFYVTASTTATSRFNQTGGNNILELQNSGTNVLTVSSVGATLIKTSTNNANALQVQTSGAASILNVDTTAGDVTIAASAVTYTERLCHNQVDGSTTNLKLGDCQAAGQADLAEFYDTDGPVEAGDIVAPSAVGDYAVQRSSGSYATDVIGVVSTNPVADGILGNNVKSAGRQPVALAGRVPLKVSLENGPIAIGDPLTSSSTAGVAMKATGAGPIIGTALEAYSAGSERVSALVLAEEADRAVVHAKDLPSYRSNPAAWAPGIGKIMFFVRPGYRDPTSEIQGVASYQQMDVQGSTITASLNVSGLAAVSSLSVTGTASIAHLEVTEVVVAGDLTINGHIVSGGNSATIETAEASCAGAEATITGTDTAGTIIITTGAGCSQSGTLSSVVFAKQFSATPHIAVTPASESASMLKFYLGSTNVYGFELRSSNAPSDNTTYVFNFVAIQ